MLSLLLGAALGAAASALSPSPPDALLTFRLALRPSAPGLAALHAALHASADPASPGWGQHLSREAADALTRPPAAQARAVLAHLAASCAASAELTRSHEWAVVRASPACAQALFGVAAVQHAPGVHRCAGQPRVPQGLEAAVAAVAPCSRAPGQGALVVRARGGSAAAAAAAAASTTPATIRAQYGLGKYEGSGAGRIQVAGFLDEFAEDADLQAFFRSFYPPGVGRTFAVVGPNGRVSGVEAALDVQYVMSIGANLSTTFWYTDAGSAPNPCVVERRALHLPPAPARPSPLSTHPSFFPPTPTPQL
jgi:tripeptidyl-peptidase-1